MYERHHEPLISREMYLAGSPGAGDWPSPRFSPPCFWGSPVSLDRGTPVGGLDPQRRDDPRRDGAGRGAENNGGKLFAASYALFSGLMFIVVAGSSSPRHPSVPPQIPSGCRPQRRERLGASIIRSHSTAAASAPASLCSFAVLAQYASVARLAGAAHRRSRC